MTDVHRIEPDDLSHSLWFYRNVLPNNAPLEVRIDACHNDSNARKGIAKQFDVRLRDTTLGATLFLIAYAAGCELWAPWCEGASPGSVRSAASATSN